VRKLDTKKILRLVSFRLKDVLLLLFMQLGDGQAIRLLLTNWQLIRPGE
jgi:hypothetical protein